MIGIFRLEFMVCGLALGFWGSHNLQALSEGPHSRFQLGCRSRPITCNHIFCAYVEEESICSCVADLDVHVSSNCQTGAKRRLAFSPSGSGAGATVLVYPTPWSRSPAQ